jgi:hypothetical protein
MKGLGRGHDPGGVTEWLSPWLASSIVLWSLGNRRSGVALGGDCHYSPILALSFADGCCRSEKSLA